jgi:hypothetical protein
MLNVTSFEFNSTGTEVTIYATGFGGVEKVMRDIKVPSQERFELSLEQVCNGVLVQDAFPYLNADIREFMITGTTPEEWNQIFPKED